MKERMASIFAEEGPVRFGLHDIEVQFADTGATATAHYDLHIDDVTTATFSGILTFSLSKATGFWRITRIDS